MKTESSTSGSPGMSGERMAGSAAGNEHSRDSGSFGDAAARITEIREYVAYYIAAKADSLKMAVRSIVLYTVLGIVGLIAAAAAVVTAVVLLLQGLADAIGAATGMHWLGELIIGIAILAIIGIGAMIVVSKVTQSSRKKTVEKYESRKRDQRFRFGHDVKQRAHEAP